MSIKRPRVVLCGIAQVPGKCGASVACGIFKVSQEQSKVIPQH